MAKDFTEQNFQNLATNYSQEENEETMATNMATNNDQQTYTQAKLASNLGKSERTIRTWIKCIKDAYHWLDETEISFKKGKKIYYTAFTLSQLEDIKEYLKSGDTLNAWVQMIESAINPESQEEAEGVEYSVAEDENPYAITVEPLPERPKLIKYEPKNFEVPEVLRQPTINQKLDNLIEIATAQTEAEIEKANAVSAQLQAAQEKVMQVATLYADKKVAEESAHAAKSELNKVDNLLELLTQNLGK